jgi:hypothetical protein
MGDEGVLMEAIELYGDESDKFQLDLPITERVNVPLARHLTPSLNVTLDFVLNDIWRPLSDMKENCLILTAVTIYLGQLCAIGSHIVLTGAIRCLYIAGLFRQLG